MRAEQLLRNLSADVPYAIHIVLTDTCIQFANQERQRFAFQHIFNRVCLELGIEHRLDLDQASLDQWPSRAHEPNDQEATVKRYHYDRHQQFKSHLNDFVNAYHYGRRLKTLKDVTSS